MTYIHAIEEKGIKAQNKSPDASPPDQINNQQLMAALLAMLASVLKSLQILMDNKAQDVSNQAKMQTAETQAITDNYEKIKAQMAEQQKLQDQANSFSKATQIFGYILQGLMIAALALTGNVAGAIAMGVLMTYGGLGGFSQDGPFSQYLSISKYALNPAADYISNHIGLGDRLELLRSLFELAFVVGLGFGVGAISKAATTVESEVLAEAEEEIERAALGELENGAAENAGNNAQNAAQVQRNQQEAQAAAGKYMRCASIGMLLTQGDTLSNLSLFIAGLCTKDDAKKKEIAQYVQIALTLVAVIGSIAAMPSANNMSSLFSDATKNSQIFKTVTQITNISMALATLGAGASGIGEGVVNMKLADSIGRGADLDKIQVEIQGVLSLLRSLQSPSQNSLKQINNSIETLTQGSLHYLDGEREYSKVLLQQAI